MAKAGPKGRSKTQLNATPSKPKPKRGRKPKKAKTNGNDSSDSDTDTENREANLQTGNAAVRDEYGMSRKTKDNYIGYRKRTRKFLRKLVKQRRKDGVDVCSEGIPTDDLERSLDDGEDPNQHSAYVIELYITELCIREGRGHSSAEGIQSAWCKHYDNLDVHGRFRGEYKFDRKTGVLNGNPARAHSIMSLVKTIKVRERVKGADATRNHAEALSIEDLRKIVQYCESKCSGTSLAAADPQTFAELQAMYVHGLIKTMVPTGFCLWTRIFELCWLQKGDITLNCTGREPHKFPYHRVHLEERKGWQREHGWDGNQKREENTYEIYEETDTPEADVFHSIQSWITFVEKRIGRELEDDDFIFPCFRASGHLDPKSPLAAEYVQKLLNEVAGHAGVTKRYTTHCLRRGGAQYRFMFAPIGKRWSLRIVRWWGGWGYGENVETLCRYLLDCLQSYESGHSDAMCPVPREADRSFMGEHKLLEPVNQLTLDTTVKSLATELIEHVNASQKEVIMRQEEMTYQMQQTLAACQSSFGAGQPYPAFAPAWPSTFESALCPTFNNVCNSNGVTLPQVPPFPAFPYSFHDSPVDTCQPNMWSWNLGGGNMLSMGAPVDNGNGEMTFEHNQHNYGSFQQPYSFDNPAQCHLSNNAPAIPLVSSSSSSSHRRWNEKRVPQPGMPVFEPLSKGSDAWREAVKQYDDVIERMGRDFFRGVGGRALGSNFHHRELVATAFTECGRDEATFLQRYPAANRGFRYLLESLRQSGKHRRTSKFGTPEERDARRQHDGP